MKAWKIGYIVNNNEPHWNSCQNKSLGLIEVIHAHFVINFMKRQQQGVWRYSALKRAADAKQLVQLGKTLAKRTNLHLVKKTEEPVFVTLTTNPGDL